MNDETRKLLKIFGVAVTDFEAEAEKLAATAAQLSPDSSRDQVAKLMKDAAELSRELNARWLEITQRVFALQERLLSALRRGGREGAVIGRTASRISSSLTGLALVMSIVGLAPVVGSFSDSRFVPGLVQPLIHLLSASIASGGKENLSWPKKTAPALTSFAFAAWQTSRPQAA